ncbi:MAG: PD40 domain-containing protein, partial [Solirubrobacteraceae bacterium]|nr:PD40 domain-containing protein [Solirubrobacteraceae bacterium]
MPPCSRILRRVGLLIAAAAVLVGLGPSAALAKPTASELVALIDGRIPGLERVGEAYDISVRPGGQEIAFIAGITSAQGGTVDDAVWTIAADGSTLREVVAETPGAEGYYEYYRAPSWSPSGRYLTFTHSFPHHPRSSTLVVDLTKPATAEPLTLYGGSGAVFSADERFVVARTGGRDGWPGITAFELATGAKFLAQDGDGIPARAWTWTPACARASQLGAAPNGSAGQVAAQLSLPRPGCRLLSEPPSSADLTEMIDGRIPHVVGFGDVRPSPSGSRIAFVAEVDPPGETTATDQLWLISLDGEDLTRLEASGTRAPEWSPAYPAFDLFDLKWQPGTELLAFRIAMRSTDRPAYWSVLDLSGILPVVRGGSADVADERFPDGPLEADAPAAEVVKLAELIDGRVDGLLRLDQIVTSPDGAKLAFRAWANHPESVSAESEIWVVNADGTGLTPVRRLGAGFAGANAFLLDPRFSADGRCLLYAFTSTSGQPRTRGEQFPLDGEGSCAPPKPP